MKRKYSFALQIVVFVLTVFLVFFSIFWCGAIGGFSYPQYIITGAVGFIFSWFFVSFMHELGHILAGLLFGFRVERLKIYHLMFYYNKNTPVVAIDPKSGVAGACEMYPVKERNIEKNYFALTAGGIVLTSIIFFVVLFITIYFGLNNVRPEVYPVFSFFIMWLPASFFYTFFNAIPFENEDGKSDGGVLLGIKKKHPSELTAVNILKIHYKMYVGLRPSEIDRYLFFSPSQLPETDVNFILLTQLQYMYCKDMGETKKAAEYLNRLESIYDMLPSSIRPEIAADLLYEYSLKSAEFGKTDGYFNDCIKILKRKNAYACRVLAAYELSFGRKEVAKQCVEEAEKLLSYEKMKGKAAYEKILIDKLKKFIK